MAAAAVVVANPVIPPRSDVQIPAVQLSGSGDPLGMLDEDFLNAIAPAPPKSNNPFVILRDLITSLAADATYLGTNAIIDAFVAGATAVTQPELTASSLPYVADVPSIQVPPGVVVAPNLASINPLSLPTYLPAEVAIPTDFPDLMPVVSDVLTAVVNDVSFVGNELVTAAFAAGAALAAQPALIFDTLRALIQGDIRGALAGAVDVVSAQFEPPRIVLEAIGNVVSHYLPPLPAVPALAPLSLVQAPAPGASLSAAPPAVVEQDAPSRRQVVAEKPVAPPRPVASVAVETVDEPADNAPAPVARTERPVRSGPVGKALTAVADQAKTALRNAGERVRKAAGRDSTAVDGPSGE